MVDNFRKITILLSPNQKGQKLHKKDFKLTTKFLNRNF